MTEIELRTRLKALKVTKDTVVVITDSTGNQGTYFVQYNEGTPLITDAGLCVTGYYGMGSGTPVPAIPLDNIADIG